jgi:hypothetical protein
MVNITQEEQDTQFIIDNFDDMYIDILIGQYNTPFKKLFYKLEFLQSRNRKIKAIDALWMIKPFINRILEVHSVNVFKRSLMAICCDRISRGFEDSDIESIYEIEYDTTNYIKLNNMNTSLAIKRIVDEQYWNLFLN